MSSLPAPARGRAFHVGDAFRLLLRRTERRVEGGTRSPATLEMQRQHVRYLLERIGGETPIARLTPARIARLLEAERQGRRPGKPLSGGTLRKRAYTLSQALELARGRPPRLPEIPYVYEPRTRFMETFDDYERLRDRLSERRRLWFVLATWTGQRRGDVERMVKEDLDPRGLEPWVAVRSRKTRGGRVKIHASPELVRELGAWWEQLAAGAKLVEAWPHANSDLRYHCQRLGLQRFSTHSLRHTFFTWYVAANGFTAELLEIGGWKDLRIPALVYAHALPVRFRDQIERTVAVATSLRRGPRKSLAQAKNAGTSSVGNSAERVGPAAPARAAGPVTSPVRTHEAGLDRSPRPSVKTPTSRAVPRDRVELSTHGFSEPRVPATSGPPWGDLPMEGPPCLQSPPPVQPNLTPTTISS